MLRGKKWIFLWVFLSLVLVVIVILIALIVWFARHEGLHGENFRSTQGVEGEHITEYPEDHFEAMPGDESNPVSDSELMDAPTSDSMNESAEGVVSRENPFTDSQLLQYAGNAYYSIFFFSSEEEFFNEESPKMPAASVIKVFIMQYTYSLVEAGELSLNDSIGGQNISNLIHAMIRWSDNDATNILIDYLGMDSINQYLYQQGFTSTVLQRRMLDMEARALGLDNFTSTADVMNFLNRLYHNRMSFPYNEMLDIMLGQEINTKIPLFLPASAQVANKTGELPDVENDMGLVFTEEFAFAIVVLTSEVRNTYAIRQAIGELARSAYDYALYETTQ